MIAARRGFSAGILASVLAVPAAASDWFEPGDARLRSDLASLVDAGWLDLPMLGWPIPREDVCDALTAGRAAGDAPPERLAAALGRLHQHCGLPSGARAYATGGDPGLLHGFEAEPRADGVVGIAQSWRGTRAGARLELSLAANPDDDLPFRPDGSYAALDAANWRLSAGWLDRWWGPGWDGSLILSNNPRPIPGLALDRIRSTPFESRWLSWLGPWRATAFLGALENERTDVDRPLFLGLRVAARPLPGLEIALSRSAQFCGEGLPCSLSSFGDLLVGNDNAGADVAAEDEPGNQMAGFELRWSSPVGDAPYAVYLQMIGEDQSSVAPIKWLGLAGVEGQLRIAGRDLHLFAEYVDIKCTSSTASKVFDCAYRQSLFFAEGYRFRGRVIGHVLDSDGRMGTLGAMWSTDAGWWVDLRARAAAINRGGEPDPWHTISPTPVDFYDLAAGARRDFDWGTLRIRLGAEHRRDADGSTDTRAAGFIGFERRFGTGGR